MGLVVFSFSFFSNPAGKPRLQASGDMEDLLSSGWVNIQVIGLMSVKMLCNSPLPLRPMIRWYNGGKKHKKTPGVLLPSADSPSGSRGQESRGNCRTPSPPETQRSSLKNEAPVPPPNRRRKVKLSQFLWLSTQLDENCLFVCWEQVIIAVGHKW